MLARLALFPHPHLSEYLLEPALETSARTIYSTVTSLSAVLVARATRVPDITKLLASAREGHIDGNHQTLLEAVIALDDFTRELAAICHVKSNATTGNMNFV